MASISRCPLCNEPVSVPDGLAEQAQVRCPLCEKEFPLSDVGDPEARGAGSGVQGAREEFPMSDVGEAADLAPELVPVADLQSEGPMLDVWKNQQPVDEVPEIHLGSVLRKPEASAEEPAEGADGLAEEQAPEPVQDPIEAAAVATEQPAAEMSEAETGSTEAVTETGELLDTPASGEIESGEGLPVPQAEEPAESKEEPDLVVRCPHCEAESKLRELIVASSGERVDVPTLAAALGLVPASEAEAGPNLSVWGESVSTAPQFDFGQQRDAGAEEVPGGAFAFADSQDGEKASGSAASRARRRKGDKSLVKEMVGAAFGAVLAVPIAYYLLNLIGGERFDKVPIPLPFCPHTYDHLPSDWPDWWPGWAKLSAPAAETESGDLEIALDDPETDEALRRLDEARQGFSPAGEPAVPVAPQPEEPPRKEPRKEPRNSARRAPVETASSKAGGNDAKTQRPAEPGAEEARGSSVESPAAKPDKKPSKAGDNLAAAKTQQADPETDPAPPESELQASEAITPAAYRKLRRVAEAITAVEGEPDAGAAGKQEAVRGVLRKAARDPEDFDTIGKLAGEAWEQPDAEQHGILLAGTVARSASQGKGHQAEIELAGGGGTVPVLSDQPLELAEGDRVLVLGSIVQNADEKLADYDLSQSKVVWAGLTLKMGE